MKNLIIYVFCFILLNCFEKGIRLDGGLHECQTACEKQQKEFKNFGWDTAGKKFCRCGDLNIK